MISPLNFEAFEHEGIFHSLEISRCLSSPLLAKNADFMPLFV
ncbi:hypothetical protein GPLA_2178 [Paraglaciecola polaris LMG 21857]|uniref:Uncharacterized protein n=1 Tax=Paraglaciecola polaris LMG 21857 TaxID=1129793 RepID=K6ZWC0_9ALTE|nr:hypothetical protein GPLA_2178 [Paraglaciecola polaris LMG 21857]